MLFVRSYFAWAEVVLVANFFNLSSLYFRHNAYPRAIHLPAVSGPLAWTFVAIYWNGAIMVPHHHSLVARVFANIFVWSILAYGGFFIVAYRVSWESPSPPPTLFFSKGFCPLCWELMSCILTNCPTRTTPWASR